MFLTIENGGKVPTYYGIAFLEQTLYQFALVIRASIMSKPKFRMSFQIFMP
jgi:hypothetical protein